MINGFFGRIPFSYKARGERKGKIPRKGEFDEVFLQELDTKKDKDVLSEFQVLGFRFHMWPDCDVPGERLFLQLKEVLPDLVRHQLPPGCKDYSEYYVRMRSEE
jgi:hypothetical protein